MRLNATLALLIGIVALNSTFGDEAVRNDARVNAAHRQRQVIFNNDGDDAFMSGAPSTPEGFLSLRMDHISNCGVDSVFYCTTESTNLYTHNSKVTEVMTAKAGLVADNRISDLIRLQTDPLKLAIDACRHRNIEIFWTLRMNDTHDAFIPEFLSQWKKEHPEFLMGTPKEGEKYRGNVREPRQIWSWADFAHQEVRNVTLLVIQDVLNRYDVDGIDLDFLRHPCHFQETRRFEPVTAEHRDMLTDLVGRIRAEVLAASTRKSKPILLSARILPTLELNQRFGFDAETWLDKGYLDLLIAGGGYDPFTTPAEMIDRGHARHVPVYRCLSLSGMVQNSNMEHSALSGDNIAAWRAAAANAWHDGADGIMTFNLFPHLPETQHTQFARTAWKEMCDAASMVGKDKLYCIEQLHYDDWCWMLRSCPRDGRLPATLDRGAAVTRILPVADNIASQADQIQGLRLRIYLDGLQNGDEVEVTLNGSRIHAMLENPMWLATDVSPEIMKQGQNELLISFVRGNTKSLVVRSVELTVDYKDVSVQKK